MFVPYKFGVSEIYWDEGTPKDREFAIGERETNWILPIDGDIPEGFEEIIKGARFLPISYAGLPKGFVESRWTRISKKILERLKLYKEDNNFRRNSYTNKKYPNLILRDKYEVGVREICIGSLRKDSKYPIWNARPISGSNIKAKSRDAIIDTLWIRQDLIDKVIDYSSGVYQPIDKTEKQILELIKQIGAESIEVEQIRCKTQENN